ncbi:SWI/SNF complex subunit SWI3C [Apostasia shenzhenica]|uniref:SWI/SNF complex subunit SWI3C n=1 Tax=Apostasia shenzhenica TaxID=1088818 RepID=A0A2I0AP57_9ASPA|nr:SWI/SNF complex subunit SWI3C [Apostasia shenzhenica]
MVIRYGYPRSTYPTPSGSSLSAMMPSRSFSRPHSGKTPLPHLVPLLPSAMSSASPSLPSSDSQLKWRKRKRESNLKRQPNPRDDEEEDEDDEGLAAGDDDVEDGVRESPAANLNTVAALDLRQSEVLSDGGQQICDFPAVFRRTVNRPHPSVVSIVAAERQQFSGSAAIGGGVGSLPFLENISHGQLQSLSSVLSDHPSLQPPDVDRPSAYVCTPPILMEGKGIMRRFGNDQTLFVPMHSDWFSPNTIHRLERQVVPHFFSRKSAEHTPEKYMCLRNKIIAKYMENPGRRLSFADCQGLATGNELYDLSRIVRFLDHWGIINYLSSSSVHRGLRMAGSLLREDANGELNVQTGPLRSIDSLILFDRPKSSVKLEDMAFLSTSSSSVDSDSRLCDLDVRIRERFSERSCSYCSTPLPSICYQSQKEVDTILCSECFNDAKFVTGHSSVDFVKMHSKKDFTDTDGDSWTDQETYLLLEALEKYNDNWNEIAEHVGTKSKAQCILHFIRLPMEDGLLENIELPVADVAANSTEVQNNGFLCSHSNGDTTTSELNCGNQLPFASSANPVMSLVAFLASAIGPRVAAVCASAALSDLTKQDPRSSLENEDGEADGQGVSQINLDHRNDESVEDNVTNARNGVSSPLSSEQVKDAAIRGLSSAAMKAKLFADQEEREVQRLSANIINHQLKRLELKLKQFAEIETLLLKECEQVERTRQRLSAERARMISARFAPSGALMPAAAGAASVGPLAPSSGNVNPRPVTMPAGSGQPNLPPVLTSNMPHPHMQFMQRPQQMFSFGPRLPLSAIQPPSSGSPQNMMFNPAVGSTFNHHSLLRSSSGNNSSMG